MKKRKYRDVDRHRTPEAVEFDTLQDLGFELDPPEDYFSDQPDSGGTIGGRRGDQEYGIRGGIAEEDVRPEPDEVDRIPDEEIPYDEGALDENDEGDIPAVSEWSAEHAIEDEDYISNEYESRDEKVAVPMTRKQPEIPK